MARSHFHVGIVGILGFGWLATSLEALDVVLGGVVTKLTVREVGLVVELSLWHRQAAGEEADEGTGWNGDSPSDGNTGELEASLGAQVTVRVVGVQLFDLGIILKAVGGDGCANTCGDGAKSAGDTVEPLDATGVVKVEVLLAKGIELEETVSRDCTAKGTSEHGPAWVNNQIGSGAHHHSTGKGRVQEDLHVELSVVSDEAAHDGRGDT